MKDMITIRSCELDDIPMLTALEKEIFGDYGYPMPVMRQWFDICGNWIRIAESEGRTAGYILSAPSADSTCVWVLSLLVHEGFRRRGVASSLLRTLEPMAQARNIPEIRLTVAPSNTAGRSLYESCGYHEAGLEPDYFGPGQDRLVMVRVPG